MKFFLTIQVFANIIEHVIYKGILINILYGGDNLGIFKRKKKEINPEVIEQQAAEIIETVENKIDKIEDEEEKKLARQAAEQTLKEAQNLITNNSNADSFAELTDIERQKAVELLKNLTEMIAKSDKIPKEAKGEMLLKLIKEDSPEVAVEVAQNVSLPDNALEDIIMAPEVGIKDAEDLVTGIEDDEKRKKVQENIDIAKLRNIYNKCEEINIEEKFIENLLRVLETIENKSSAVKEMLNKVVAKRMALDVLRYGNSKLNRFSKVIPPIEMLEINLPKLVRAEYEKILLKDKDLKTKYPYDERCLKNMIIEQVGKAMAEQYLSQPAVSRVLVPPNSDAIRNLTEDEEDVLIESVKIACKGIKVKGIELEKLRNQLHGIIGSEEAIELKDKLDLLNPDIASEIAGAFNNMFDRIKEFPDEDKVKIASLLDTMTEQITTKLKALEDNNKREKVPDDDVQSL